MSEIDLPELSFSVEMKSVKEKEMQEKPHTPSETPIRRSGCCRLAYM